jgi:cell division protein FtsB
MTKKNFDFVFRYWITLALIAILSILIRQNFFINQFPSSLVEKQVMVNKNEKINHLLEQQNKIKSLELQAKNAVDMEILESQVRHRFGLVKEGEHYYQITKAP